MTPGICLPPIILDQSFPRDEDELQLIAIALGKLELLFKQEHVARLIITDAIKELVEEVDWGQPFSLIGEIHRLLNQLVLQPHKFVITLNVSQVEEYAPHPYPNDSSQDELIEFWADELGRILAVHDSCCERGEYFIGVACAYAFAGEGELSQYDNPDGRRAFPFVGSESISEVLSDAFTWALPPDHGPLRARIKDAKKPRKYELIGGLGVESGGDHLKLMFENGAWPFKTKDEFIPKDGLRELSDLTGYPPDVIRVALATGTMPRRVFKLQAYCI